MTLDQSLLLALEDGPQRPRELLGCRLQLLRHRADFLADVVLLLEQVGAAGGDVGVIGRDLGEVVAVEGIGGGQVGIIGEVVRQFASGRQERRGGVIPLGIGRTTAQRRAGAEERDDLALL